MYLAPTADLRVPGRLAAPRRLLVPLLQDPDGLVGHVDCRLDPFLDERLGYAVGDDRADATAAESVQPEHGEDGRRFHLEGQDPGPLEVWQQLLDPGLGIAVP